MPEGPRIRSFPLHRVRVERMDEPPEQGNAEELRLRHEGERTGRAGAHHRRVEVAHVIRRQDEGALAWDLVPADRPEPESQPENPRDHRFQDRVEHTRSTSFAISSMTSSTV